MTDTLSSLRADLTLLRIETGKEMLFGDELCDERLMMIVALEEALAAPWWRRPAAMRRWRRDIRASVAEMDGSTWQWRRLNTIATGWVNRPGTGHEVSAGWNPPLPDHGSAATG
jgi:hypothetical protein